MYKEHPAFEKPEDENAKIWRYVDFTKFVSLLDRSSLFFSRVDRLDDPFEGSYSKANIPLRPIVYDTPENELKGLSELIQRARELFAVSCWHLNDYESAAMWKLYLKSGGGIAIRSTFDRLKNCLMDETPDVYIGEVKYIDYERDFMAEGNVLSPLMYKRKSFEHERELRAVVQVPSENGKALFGDGLFISVDLGTLIDKIYLAPTSAKWLFELVESVTRKYGLDKEVLQSSLDDVPVY